jgi:hypothetical protein
MNQVVQAFAAAGVRPVPGAQIGGSGMGGAAGRGAGPLAEAGSYTVTATLGDVTLTSRVQVVTGGR